MKISSIFAFVAFSSMMTASAKDAALVPTNSRFAYVTLLCNPAEHDQAEHIRMLLVLKESIRQFDKDNEMVTMVYGGINEEQWEILDQEGFNIIQVNDVGAMVSDPEPLRVPDTVSACYRSKLNALHLTQYDKIIFLDNDMLVKQDLRFMFEEEGFVAYEGSESPLNAGLFAVDPSETAFNDMEKLILSDSFHPQDGWRSYGPFPHWQLHGHMSDWSFWCAHTDQGVLYYYYDKFLRTATIRPMKDAMKIATHFTGWRKPILHKHEESSDAVGVMKDKMMNDPYTTWYYLWDSVQSRLERVGKHYPSLLHEHITSTEMAVESRLRRTLQDMKPYDGDDADYVRTRTVRRHS